MFLLSVGVWLSIYLSCGDTERPRSFFVLKNTFSSFVNPIKVGFKFQSSGLETWTFLCRSLLWQQRQSLGIFSSNIWKIRINCKFWQNEEIFWDHPLRFWAGILKLLLSIISCVTQYNCTVQLSKTQYNCTEKVLCMNISLFLVGPA